MIKIPIRFLVLLCIHLSFTHAVVMNDVELDSPHSNSFERKHILDLKNQVSHCNDTVEKLNTVLRKVHQGLKESLNVLENRGINDDKN